MIPRPNRVTPADVRFWRMVQKTDGCWLWTASVTDMGYGRFNPTTSSKGRKVGAHRYAYELLVGPIPPGLMLDHICHDPATCAGGRTCPHRRCVNPSHLVPVTCRENLLRGATLAAANAAKTHCPQGHPYAGSNLRMYKGERDCRACVVLRRRNQTDEQRAREAERMRRSRARRRVAS